MSFRHSIHKATRPAGNANSVVYGSNYIIRIYVENSSAAASLTGPPAPTCETVNVITCPTGTAALAANGSPVDGGTYALNGMGYTRDLAPTLTGGTYSLVAKYSGDNSYTASVSATDTFTVTPAATSMSLSVGGSPTVGTADWISLEGAMTAPGGVTPKIPERNEIAGSPREE